MPQLRKDPISNRWIIVNVESPRPADSFEVAPPVRSTKTCPFCPGNESMTPPEIAAYGRKLPAKNAPGWQVRVIPNKFPALKIEETTEKSAMGLYDKVGGFGAHEVIIETPDHEKELSDVEPEQVELVLKTWRDRCLDLRKDPRFHYILIFKNVGPTAGATQEHAHSQLIGLPIIPSRVLGEAKGALEHYHHSDRCIYCDILDQELTEKKLIVSDGRGFVAVAPFASRSPFEVWLLPHDHAASFDAITDEALKNLAAVLKETLLKMKIALRGVPYNLMIHTIPIGSKDVDAYHWHIEIIPQLVQIAGFELGTGFYVNPTPPEIAAETLRRVLL